MIEKIVMWLKGKAEKKEGNELLRGKDKRTN